MTQPKSFPWLHWLRTLVAWLVTLVLFFPLGWLVLTGLQDRAASHLGAAADVLHAHVGELPDRARA